MLSNLPSPIQEIHSEILSEKEVSLFIKRDDLIHPNISGNKWRKLLPNIELAKKEGKDTIISFGGPFSNHIYSLAAAGDVFGLKTIGIIRGEDADETNPTLRYALECGMKLIKVSREAYRDKEVLTKHFEKKYPNALIVPEGGSSEVGALGTFLLVKELKNHYDYICCPVGTGGTIAGIIHAELPLTKVLGFPTLKNFEYLKSEVQLLSKSSNENWELLDGYHFGGYAKFNTELVHFMDDFKTNHNIQLEPIYTAKMMYGILDLIQKDYFPKKAKVLAVHTGGLQGLQGLSSKIEKLR